MIANLRIMIDYERLEMFSELNKTLKRIDTDAQS